MGGESSGRALLHAKRAAANSIRDLRGARAGKGFVIAGSMPANKRPDGWSALHADGIARFNSDPRLDVLLSDLHEIQGLARPEPGHRLVLAGV